jgi:hypothetical protein
VRNAECGFKPAVQHSAFRTHNSAIKSSFRLGFAETGDTVAVFALAAFFEEFGAFKTLENIALATKGGSGAEAAML